MSKQTEKRPSIRQQYADMTRQSILEAAQFLFATKGFTETGVRDIAEKANVNPALIGRYYGSKIALFEAALESSVDVSYFIEMDRASFGEQVAAAFCRTEEEEALMIPSLILSAGDTEARAVALKVLKKRAEEPLTTWFGGDEAADKADQMIILVMGFFTHRLMLPLKSMQDKPSQGMQDWLARTLQEIVDR